MSALDYERDFEQVRVAIERRANAHADEAPEDGELRHFCASAFALAILAVIELAQERSQSVEAVLDRLSDYF